MALLKTRIKNRDARPSLSTHFVVKFWGFFLAPRVNALAFVSHKSFGMFFLFFFKLFDVENGSALREENAISR